MQLRKKSFRPTKLPFEHTRSRLKTDDVRGGNYFSSSLDIGAVASEPQLGHLLALTTA